jgi:hypothetical protein
VNLLAGKKLLIRDKATDDSKRKIVVISKDTSISPPWPWPTDVEATLTIQNTGTTTDSQTFTLPAKEYDGSSGWKALGNPEGSSGFRYLDRNRTHSACKLVLIKPGKLLRALCKGSQIDGYSLNEDDQVSVGVKLSIGNNDYCMLFEDNPQGALRLDQSTGEKTSQIGVFRAIDAAAPTSCLEP